MRSSCRGPWLTSNLHEKRSQVQYRANVPYCVGDDPRNLPTALFVGKTPKSAVQIVEGTRLPPEFRFAVPCVSGRGQLIAFTARFFLDFIPNDELHRYYSSPLSPPPQ